MLTITREYLELHRREDDQRLLLRYREVIDRAIGDAGFALGEVGVEQEKQRLLSKAREFGLRTDAALVTFIVLGIRAASHFYLYPKFHAALTDRQVKESNRMMTIVGTSTVDDWRSASMCGEEAVS